MPSPNIIVAKVDRDYIAEENEPSRVGLTWSKKQVCDSWVGAPELEHIVESCQNVRWRVKDDDAEIYYGGWLLNDGMGIVQQTVLRWAEYDAGATTIEVKLNDEWVQEIG